MNPLDLHDVRANVSNGVTAFTGRENQLVLAEHLARENAEDSPGFRLHDHSGHRCRSLTRRARLGHPLFEMFARRLGEVGKRGDVALDPLGAPDHSGVR